MKEALINLLKVKSLMTIAVMIVFVVLALSNKIDEALTASVITAVITYYFTKNETSNSESLIAEKESEKNDW
mgnify:CR=1 FL=1